MSKENAIEFFKLSIENPGLFDEAKKHTDSENFYEALSKLAKEKGFECSAEEIEEAEGMLSKLSSGELDEDDLASVAGGSFLSDAWNKAKKWYNDNEYKFKAAWEGAKSGWSNATKS